MAPNNKGGHDGLDKGRTLHLAEKYHRRDLHTYTVGACLSILVIAIQTHLIMYQFAIFGGTI